MDIWESVENLTDKINDIIFQRNFSEKKAKEYEERIYNTIKKIEHYIKYCGYDDRTTIHDKELNELLKILEGEENEKENKINVR